MQVGGDYHYIIPNRNGWYEKMVQNPDSEGYSITEYGVLTVKRIIEEPYKVTICSADEGVRVFVSSDSELDMAQKEVYLKFDEKRSVFEQLSAFVKDYGIDFNTIERNENVTAYVGGEKEESLIDMLKISIMDSNAGLVYFLGGLNENKTLMNNVVFVLLLFFIMYAELFAITSLGY